MILWRGGGEGGKEVKLKPGFFLTNPEISVVCFFG